MTTVPGPVLPTPEQYRPRPDYIIHHGRLFNTREFTPEDLPWRKPTIDEEHAHLLEDALAGVNAYWGRA